MSLKSGTWVRLCSSFLHLKPPISEPFAFSIDCENPLISQGSIIVVPLKQRQRHSAASSAISLIGRKPIHRFLFKESLQSNHLRHRSNFEISSVSFLALTFDSVIARAAFRMLISLQKFVGC
ncbi:hypothetical protein MRB53_001342 [Persea americana]|uniref:Uncharacterized protein n=1 Tax=Persea americana TaxID=3435 RepID=A0ACC2MRL0_PERAE|nr:hypothetical protein MRB53_001342 [Persea americana]